ncbi:MAG: L-aspartate oxidase [Candidatus Thorarchaeota archaeon]|nr:L-aspartate oxidase [Candidatus Thorarchaeota archaeon]
MCVDCRDVKRVSDIVESDILVIGSGIAGLSFSLNIPEDYRIAIITKATVSETATNRAQGGIAAVISDKDSLASHIEDTIRVGAGLCHPHVVESIVRSGPIRIRELVQLGVEFCKEEGCDDFDLGLEGGHTNRRVLHVKDHTGADIQRVLVEQVQKRANISIYEDHSAVNLYVCDNRVMGAYVLDKGSRIVKRFPAKVTVLATGGAGRVFLYTSNPDVATGDGIAMAYRAGASITNLEFIQFHPTLLYHPKIRSFLISEALRGEGAVLLGPDGKRFMEDYHPDAELAPRDVVARAIDNELKRTGASFVHLDISFKDADFIIDRFPAIYSTCLKAGIDITQDPIPVVPAVHYVCGGVKADVHGRTDVHGLYAIGECAGTGFHGANRLASNSLLEGVVMAHNAAISVTGEIGRGIAAHSMPAWDPGEATDPDELVVISHMWDEVRRLMVNYVGIVRTNKRLIRARNRIGFLAREIESFYWDFIITPDLVELRNIATVAELIIKMARMRKESRGAHYNRDYPDTSVSPVDTIIKKGYKSINDI